MAKRKCKKRMKFPNGGSIPKYYNGTPGTTQYGAQVSLGNYQIRDDVQRQQSIQTGIPTAYGNAGFDNYSDYYMSNYDLEGSLLNSYTQPQTSNVNMNNVQSTAGTIGAAASMASGLLDSTSDNPYNQQYGYQQSAVGDIAGSSSGIGAAISGVANLGGSLAESLGAVEYNEYGVNTAGDTSGQLYTAAGASLDPFSQLEKDVQEGDWGSAAMTLLGGQTFSGIRQYNQDQEEALRVQEEAEKEKNRIAALQRRATQEQTPQAPMNPSFEYAKGGITKYPIGGKYYGEPNAELETDEVFRTPDGEIEKVPENTPSHNNGGIKLNLPEGTEILGKMKGKYNGKEYKDMGQDLKKRYDKYTRILEDGVSSTLAKNTAQKMLDKIQYEFDQLMADQEAQKAYTKFMGYSDKQVQESLAKFQPTTETSKEDPGSVEAVEYVEDRYADGGKVPKYPDGKGDLTNLEYLQSLPEETRMDAYAAFEKYMKDNKNKIEGYDSPYRYHGSNVSNKMEQMLANPESFWSPTDMTSEDLKRTLSRNKLKQSDLSDTANAFTYFYDNIYNPNFDATFADRDLPNLPSEVQVTMDDATSTDLSGTNYANTVKGTSLYSTPQDYRAPSVNYKKTNTPWWETALQVAPAAYNIGMGLFGKTDELNASDYRNPYASRVRDLADINYNVRPELTANELAYQTARRNIRQVAPSTGNLLTNYSALAGTRMRADAESLARKQNFENQAKLQGAGILSRLGAYDAQTKFAVDQYNAQAQAAKQNMLSTGIDQAAGAAVNLGSSRNAQYNDMMLGKAYQAYARNYNMNPDDPNTWMMFMNSNQGGTV